MISVIVPTYNRESTLRRALQSIENQTYKNIEIIVVDDNSNDNTQKVVETFKEKEIDIIYIKHKFNKGACAARNTGIINATGDYIAFLDSDDEWDKNKLEKQINYLKKNKADIVFCSHILKFKNKEKVIPTKQIDENNILKDLLYGNFITTGAILGKKECFIKERFNENLPRFQDWELSIRLIKNFKVIHINEILTTNFIQKDSLTNNYFKGLEALKYIYANYNDEIQKYSEVDANFNSKIAALSIQCNLPAKDYLKKSIKCNFRIKYLIKYLICIIGMENILKK